MSAKNEDHDQRDKELFDYFIDDVVRLCFPELTSHLKFSEKTNISKDFVVPVKMAENRYVDLLIEIPFVSKDSRIAYDLLIDHYRNPSVIDLETVLKEAKIIDPNETQAGHQGKQKIHKVFLEPKARFLIHLESERHATRFEMGKRMWDYYKLIDFNYADCVIFPVVVYFNQSISGIEWTSFRRYLLDKEIIGYNFIRIGLKGENAADWLNQETPLMFALSIFMKYDKQKKVEFKHQLLEKIRTSTVFTTEQKLVLNEYVEKSLHLSPTEQNLFEQLYLKEVDMPRALTVIDEIEKLKRIGRQEGIQEGIQEGRQEGMQEAISLLLPTLLSLLNLKQISYTAEDEAQIREIKDLTMLNHLLQASFKISTLEAFRDCLATLKKTI